MTRKSIALLAAILMAAIFSFHACKKADVGSGTLTVIVSVGVSGTPAAGTYTYLVGDQLAYSFTLDAGYETLTVLLDGTEVAASGTITISGDHTLKAYSDENGEYKLTVTLGNGVNGTPQAGTYTYASGTLVDYAYALDEGYADLSVKLDGVEAESSGTITMSEDFTLNASAVEKYNIQGTWALSESYADDSSFAVTATFSGNYESGSVTDSDGGSGNYAVDDDQAVTFTLVFPDVTYEYTGNFSDADTMSGTCERYQTTDDAISGTWTATRISAATAAVSRSSIPAYAHGKKGNVRQGAEK